MNSYMNARTARSIDPEVERASSGPRFVRFAATMAAEPPATGEMLDERTRAQLQHGPSAAGDFPVSRPMGARDLINPWMLWLGIGSWALLCAVLFVSLLSWQEREVLEGDFGTTSDQIQNPATVTQALRAERDQPTPMLQESLPKDRREVNSESRPDLDTSSARQRVTEPRNEASVDARVPGGPPLPRFRPAMD
jgi:hypothetical protein